MLPKYLRYLILCLLFPVAFNTLANGGMLVDVPWLVEHRKDKKLIIVDVRSKQAYAKGHIPGAVNIPVADTFSPKYNTDRVGNIQYIQQLFSEAGIRNDHKVVVYDDSSYIDAGRVFWVFEVYGHKQVKLLNGGYPGWRKNAPTGVSQSPSRLQKSSYLPAIEPNRLITKLSMRLALDDSDKLIVDSRTAKEYNGDESISSRVGHIPNAINIPPEHNFVNVDGVNMLKSTKELKAMYAELLPVNKKVYTYCNKGKHASLTYTILRQLGYDAAHYDGSWYEWGNDFALPIEQSH